MQTAWMKAVDAGSEQRAEAVASAWAATSAVGAGEAVAVAACWLVGDGGWQRRAAATTVDGRRQRGERREADGSGDGGDDGRPGSIDLGLVDDEKMATTSFGRFDGWMKL
ncbi:hypothetical protein ACLOJK_023217 [Asimina triloba]